MRRLVAATAALAVVVPLAAYAQSGGGEGASEMTHRITILVLQLAVVIIAARFVGHLFKHGLKQAAVLGELAAGILIGPYALGSIPLPILNGPLFPLELGPIPVRPELYGFAVVASIVLLFVAGLETDLPTFLRFSIKGSTIGLGGVIVSFALGDAAAVFLLPNVDSFMHPEALFLGTVSTATSVGITARILEERHKLSSPEGVTILAAAVIDDVLGIILLAVVVGVSKVHKLGGGVEWGHIGVIAAKAFGFWIVSTVLGIIFAPKLARGLRKFKAFEVTASVAFGIALFLAGLSEEAGLAMIIGAYVTGLSLSQTELANELQEYLQPLYDFFVPIFFCVMGMMANLAEMGQVLFFGLVFTALAILAKLIGCGLPALATGFNIRGALRIGAGMLPRGEVTLIVAGIGLASGAIGHDMFGVAVMTLLVASVIAPSSEPSKEVPGCEWPPHLSGENRSSRISFSTSRARGSRSSSEANSFEAFAKRSSSSISSSCINLSIKFGRKRY